MTQTGKGYPEARDAEEFAAHAKTRLVLEGLTRPKAIPTICQKAGISREEFENWTDTFVQVGTEKLTASPDSSKMENDAAVRTLSDAIESLSEGVALFDDDGRLVLLNRKQQEHLDPENAVLRVGGDLMEMTLALVEAGSLLPPEGVDAKQYAALFTEAVQTCAKDVELLASGGRHLLGSASKTPLGGRLITIEDVTDRRNTEERARELLMEVVQSLDQGLALYDSNLNFLFSNSLYIEGYYDRADVAPPGYGEHLSCGVRRLAEAGLFKIEEGFTPEDVVELAVQSSQNFLKNIELELTDGRIVAGSTHQTKLGGYLVSIKDVTDQKRTEERARSMFVDALESLREGVALWDDDEKLVFHNSKYLNFVDPEGMAHQVGRSMTEIFGAMVDDGIFLKPDEVSVEDFKKSLVDLVRSAAQDVEVPFAHGVLKGSASKTPLGGRLVTLDDITQQTRILEELERQREIALQNEKLSAMGGILAGVAHELNNPLSIVVGYALMLQEQIDKPKQKRQIERIGIAAERCARIVKAFLAMARQRPSHIQPCSINEIVGTALDISGHGLKSQGTMIELDIGSELPLISVDPDQMIQVFCNLISNAEFELEPMGTAGRLEIRTRYEAGANKVTIEVADNGAGVAYDDLDRVFEPFFTTKDVGTGTGIGLAFCHRIVASHDGTISVKSASGGGACFSLTLPVSDYTKPMNTPTLLQNAGKRASRVLVVDDEVDVTYLLRDILEDGGYEVETTNSAADALRILESSAFDAILSDIRMPGLNGEGFLKEIRETWPKLAKRVAFITGDTLSPHVASFLKSTSVEHLEKPLAPADIIDLVERLRLGKGT